MNKRVLLTVFTVFFTQSIAFLMNVSTDYSIEEIFRFEGTNSHESVSAMFHDQRGRCLWTNDHDNITIVDLQKKKYYEIPSKHKYLGFSAVTFDTWSSRFFFTREDNKSIVKLFTIETVDDGPLFYANNAEKVFFSDYYFYCLCKDGKLIQIAPNMNEQTIYKGVSDVSCAYGLTVIKQNSGFVQVYQFSIVPDEPIISGYFHGYEKVDSTTAGYPGFAVETEKDKFIFIPGEPRRNVGRGDLFVTEYITHIITDNRRVIFNGDSYIDDNAHPGIFSVTVIDKMLRDQGMGLSDNQKFFLAYLKGPRVEDSTYYKPIFCLYGINLEHEEMEELKTLLNEAFPNKGMEVEERLQEAAPSWSSFDIVAWHLKNLVDGF